MLKPFDLDSDDIEAGHVGATDDGGVDSAYFLLDRKVVREDPDIGSFKSRRDIPIELVVIQSKMSNGFSEAPILKLQAMVNDLLDPTADHSAGPYSSKLRLIMRRFRETYLALLTQRPTLSIVFYFATLADDANPEPKRKANALVGRVKELFSGAEVRFDFVTAKDLLATFNKVTPQTIKLHSTKLMPSSQFGSAYVCLVPLKEFYTFITTEGLIREDLFDSNVRDYQRDVEVNKGIESTLTSKRPVEFWWLNNGVTILSTNVTASGDILSIEEPEVVNGLQTSRKIYEYIKSGGADEDKRNVLVRVISTSDDADRDSIIRATNSQTHIQPAAFHATEDIHRQIEAFLPTAAQLYYERRKNFYRNRGVPVAKIVSITYLAQAVAAISLQVPNDAYARPTSVLKRQYSDLFNENFNPKLYSQCALLMKRVDAYLVGLPKETLDASARSDVRFYVAMYAAALALKAAAPKRDAIASLDIHSVTDELLLNSLSRVIAAYTVAGGGDEAAKGVDLITALKSELQKEFS